MANIKQISSGSDTDRENALKDIFSKMPAEVGMAVNLPSKGKVYGTHISVTVDPMTFEDEHRILNSKDRGIDPINAILEKCVKGVTVSQLLPFDKVYLLLKVREISYGPDYDFSIICPGCKSNVETSVNLSMFPVREVPNDFSDTLEVTLPVCKAKAIVRYPRVSDETYRDPDNVVKNLARYVLSINGIEDPVVISEALRRMHIRDSKTLLKAVNTDKFGVDTSFQFECPHCKHNAIMEIPLTANFFSVS